MRTSTSESLVRVLRRGALAIALSGLLAACSGSTVESAVSDKQSSGADTGGDPSSTGSGASDPGNEGSTGVGTSSSAGATSASGTGGSSSASTGVGGGTSSASTGASSSSASGGPAAPTFACAPIQNGMSTVFVNNVPRPFSVQMPADTSHMALLFLWHGWMQNPLEFANTIVYDVPLGQWVPFDPNAFPMPLMIVTPFDTKLIPPFGLDWDIAGGGNDFLFFEAMLECIKQQYNIDSSRIYSFGFSAGAVFTNLLSAKYPDLFAATVSESGAWFNDKPEQSEILVPIVSWKWPAFDPANHGNVLLTHGGPNDYATVISLEKSNQKALPFLYGAGRTVTECYHDFGHTLDPDLTQGMYYPDMWSHQLGGPPLPDLPPGFPAPWSPVGATSCVFHPAP